MWSRLKERVVVEPAQRRLLRQLRAELAEGRLDAAFALGESVLDKDPTAETFEELICLISRFSSEEDRKKRTALLALVERERSEANLPWRLYLRFLLLERLAQQEEAFQCSAALVQLPQRYGWMRYDRAGLYLIRLWSYDDAIREYRATLAAAPRFWKAQASLAESVLCQGDEKSAFEIFDACIADLPRSGSTRDLVLASVWRGELHLWMGRYERGLNDLDGPADRGVQLALGWRGAARMLLGQHDAALQDLDKAIARAPSDGEALVWRGEVWTRLGRWQDAIADFDRALPFTGDPFWALVGRALAKGHAGDKAALQADFARLPARIVGIFQRKLGIAEPPTPETIIPILEEIQRSARGLRRPEHWLRPIWVRPSY